ncbi:MAG TPA: DUF805 domain-containing protein [Allosphingosinicella sp.]|nr:DUF805 domain-containing protein [Allosphingosinicella sp.]
MDSFATAILPLKRYADFSGRSRRTELLLFFVLVAMLGLLIGLARPIVGFEAGEWMSAALSLVILCPLSALAVRQLHDSGRSGWWLLLILPSLLMSAWARFLSFGSPVPIRASALFPPFIELPAALCGFALIVLLLWADEEAANRYGPNPRYGEPEPAP